ncbi:MAG: bacillithiol biosynthesis BshC [Bacteroidetes bacterium]|nr:bacillithiol biosynthesis BshC [Bacteroidota bacterium]
MNTIFIPFAATQSFSKLAVDYVANVSTLKPFIQDFPSHISLENQIQLRKRNPVNREILHQVLSDQYQKVNITKEVASNIELLLNDKTFTICTAHQPCIFGGPFILYIRLHMPFDLRKTVRNTFRSIILFQFFLWEQRIMILQKLVQ